MIEGAGRGDRPHRTRDSRDAPPIYLEVHGMKHLHESIGKYGLDNAQYEPNVDTPQEVTAAVCIFLV